MTIMDEVRQGTLKGASYSIEFEKLIDKSNSIQDSYILFENINYYITRTGFVPKTGEEALSFIRSMFTDHDDMDMYWCAFMEPTGHIIFYTIEGKSIDSSKTALESLQRYFDIAAFS